MGVDLIRQVDLGAYYVQEVAPVALRMAAASARVGTSNGGETTACAWSGRGQPWAEQVDGDGAGC